MLIATTLKLLVTVLVGEVENKTNKVGVAIGVVVVEAVAGETEGIDGGNVSVRDANNDAILAIPSKKEPKIEKLRTWIMLRNVSSH